MQIRSVGIISVEDFPSRPGERLVVFTERVPQFAVLPLDTTPAGNTEPEIHSLCRAVETVS
jgi:hypothetical protein